MRKVLYKDKFVEVYVDEIIIKTYFFPIATSKHISINEIRCIYYRQQKCWGDIGTTKGWGMTFYPVWWACDLRRHIQYGKSEPGFNVILDTGSTIKPGFSVMDIHKFLKALRPLTNAPFENRFPETFEYRNLPPTIDGHSTSSEELLEEDDDENYSKEKEANLKQQLPPSYDEAITTTKKHLD